MGLLEKIFKGSSSSSSEKGRCPECGTPEPDHKDWCPNFIEAPEPDEAWEESMAGVDPSDDDTSAEAK